MTMHLVGPYMTTTNYRKSNKTKSRTKNQQLEFEKSHRDYNKGMKRIHAHDQMMSIEEYDLYVRGTWKPKATKFKEYKPTATFTEERKQYPSAGDGIGVAFKKETQKYTGTLITGIATMHKSNAVPIINREQAIDIANMRRN
jgi:hypothetical protein